MNVLFVCVANSGRSVMAERIFRRKARGRHEARSAGSRPGAAAHPQVLEALNEIGIGASDHRPWELDDDSLRWADLMVATCNDACPVVPASATSPGSSPIRRTSRSNAFARSETRSIVALRISSPSSMARRRSRSRSRPSRAAELAAAAVAVTKTRRSHRKRCCEERSPKEPDAALMPTRSCFDRGSGSDAQDRRAVSQCRRRDRSR